MKTRFPYAFAGALTAAMMALGAASADASEAELSASCTGVLMVVESLTSIFPPSTEDEAKYVRKIKEARASWHAVSRVHSDPDLIVKAIRLTWAAGGTEKGQATIVEIVGDCIKSAPHSNLS